MSDDKKGLGDKVADVIKFIAPKFADSKKDCIPCKERREWLNNNGTFK